MENRPFLEALTARLGPWLWTRPLGARARIIRLQRSPGDWRRLLAPERYAVLFDGEEEPPYSSPLLHENRAGTYVCAACYLPLFDARSKFDSRTGWPSFFAPMGDHLELRDAEDPDEACHYHCARCGAHQGRMYKDGPPPTGLRYNNMGLGLRFVPLDQPLPELRR